MQFVENIGANSVANSVENSVELVTDESTQSPNVCYQVVKEIIIDDSHALQNVCAEKVQSVLSKDGASSSTEKSVLFRKKMKRNLRQRFK